jgi:hypothetical protein
LAANGSQKFEGRSMAEAWNQSWRQRLKKWLGSRGTVQARLFARGLPRPRWGNMRRLTPFSTQFGFDRGTPIDRVYLHRFLDQHRDCICGDVLEIQLPGYTRKYGRDLGRTDSVDVNPDHSPTYVCDLAKSEAVIPSDFYDCFLLPNTLSVLPDLEGCLRNAMRVVKPGGCVLATGACLAPMCDPPDSDFWRLHAPTYRMILSKAWSGIPVEVESFGNCLAAAAFLMGLCAEELTDEELWTNDRRYPIATTIFARKPN